MGDDAGHLLPLGRGVVARGDDLGREEGGGVVLGDVFVAGASTFSS